MTTVHDVVHGTADGYNNHGCRCEPCSKAQAEWYAARRTPCANLCGNLVIPRPNRRGLCSACSYAARRKPEEHGTDLEYSRGCRCDECRSAATAVRLERRRRTGR